MRRLPRTHSAKAGEEKELGPKEKVDKAWDGEVGILFAFFVVE